jgi:4-hydroxybenzoate polyprenyltransferase
MNIIKIFSNYGKMVKFSHTLFALPFAGFAVILAILDSQNLTLSDLIIKTALVLICMVSARNAAMGFNRSIDMEIDSKNPRTKNRELPSGILNKNSVNIFTISFSLIFVITTYFINQLSFILSFPTLFLILFYSYTKRFTWLCHFILGIGIGIAPSGAYIAIQNSISIIPALFTFGLMFHIAGFDILYSTQDYDFDRSNGLNSIPVRFGIQKSLWIARFSHIISFSLFAYSSYLYQFGLYFYIFLCITGFLFFMEHFLVRANDLKNVPIAFFHINASISVLLFLGIIIDRWSPLIQKIRSLQ